MAVLRVASWSIPPKVDRGLLGGIPRALFQEDVEDCARKQSAAIADAAENPVRIDLGEVAEQFKHLWSIYHVVPTTDYKDYTIEMCCPDAGARLRNQLMEKDLHQLWRFFDNTLETHGSLRGIRYEAYAHKKLLATGFAGPLVRLTVDGTGQEFNIDGAAPPVVVVPPELGQFHDLPDNNVDVVLERRVRNLQERGGGYLLPSLANFPVADSLYVDGQHVILLQMKAGRHKKLSGEKATSIVNSTGAHRLYFVVPNENVIRKKLADTRGDGPRLEQYRFVLRENN